ncbi:hypothetical protein ACFQ7F_11855 [Streptomyces sp. NPDC056486]|uniref:hypothetical protein n=1 Tax=Streptomyces sp. NPDC056486 TaxID=3345835 RepID=UPI00367F7FF4
MKLDREWWRTVRYAIEEEHRTVRLIGILMTVGAITVVLVAITNGFSVTIG